MKKLLSFFIPGAFAFLFLSCGTSQYFSDQDRSVDFFSYKTFAWYEHQPDQMKNEGFDNQILESNIKNVVSSQLKLRGMQVDVDSPDVLLDYSIMVESKIRQEQVPVYAHPYNYGYNGFGYGYGNRPLTPINPYYSAPIITGYQTQEIPYTEGTLILKMVDRKTNRLIWRGWSVGTIVNEQTYENNIYRDVAHIMKSYPLPIQKIK